MKQNIIFSILIIIFLLLTTLFTKIFLSKNISISNEDISTNQISTQNLVEETQQDEPIKVELPPKEDSSLNISVIGDIMCHNSQYIDAYNQTNNTYDFSYVFEDIKENINNSDIAIGNLETTFAGKERGYSNYPQFNTPEQLAENLHDFGIDILSTANNHCMDTGYSGLESTLNYLDEAQISHIGTNRSAEEQNTILVKEVNNIKIAFLAFTYGTNGISIPEDKSYSVNLINEDFIKSQIDLAKEQNPDIICVSMHWGIEYQNKQNENQEQLANFLFQNGVDIILGSHPHVLQPMEKRSIILDNGAQKDCFVIYSLGNFMSGQTQQNTRTSIILNIDLKKDGYSGKTTIENISYIPIYTYKASSGKKYRILNIENAIFKYESGIDTSIGANNYSLFKSEVERVHNLLNMGG